jgi:hypothetical protein
VKHIAGQRQALFTLNKESHATTDNHRHLFVWVRVLRSHKEWREAKTTDHHALADDHLSLDALGRILDWNAGPVEILRVAN